MTKPDNEFLRDLDESMLDEIIAAQWLVRIGFPVTWIPKTVRPSYEERYDYVDDGDLLLPTRMEVKRRKGDDMDFTTLDEYPHKTVFVDEVYKVDRKHRLPLFSYIVLNRTRTHAIAIPRHTQNRWVKETVSDRKQGRKCHNYACPKELCSIYDIRESK